MKQNQRTVLYRKTVEMELFCLPGSDPQRDFPVGRRVAAKGMTGPYTNWIVARCSPLLGKPDHVSVILREPGRGHKRRT